MNILKKSLISMMTKDYKLLIESELIYMEQMLLKHVKVRCEVNLND